MIDLSQFLARDRGGQAPIGTIVNLITQGEETVVIEGATYQLTGTLNSDLVTYSEAPSDILFDTGKCSFYPLIDLSGISTTLWGGCAYNDWNDTYLVQRDSLIYAFDPDTLLQVGGTAPVGSGGVGNAGQQYDMTVFDGDAYVLQNSGNIIWRTWIKNFGTGSPLAEIVYNVQEAGFSGGGITYSPSRDSFLVADRLNDQIIEISTDFTTETPIATIPRSILRFGTNHQTLSEIEQMLFTCDITTAQPTRIGINYQTIRQPYSTITGQSPRGLAYDTTRNRVLRVSEADDFLGVLPWRVGKGCATPIEQQFDNNTQNQRPLTYMRIG